MKTHILFIGLLFFTASCGSDSADGKYNAAADDELVNEQVDIETKSSIDSVALASAKGELLFPVPDTLTRLVEKYQPNATLPNMPDQVLADYKQKIENPIYISGNFDGNNSPDYVVQLQKNDSVVVLAYLDYRQHEKEVWVASYPAIDVRQEQQSLYMLYKLPENEVTSDQRINQKLKTDGIVVQNRNQRTVYLYQENRFVPTATKSK
ncbi:MAG: hypothetical protein LPJ89_04870 [Hymenobacteraceae bacterium]|nr:hypothetical protein [Hymenobacteraceae bacterium]MDX5397629.1 hypothetical protein [Hymenobacteraceae bacterium]MDX5443098.1 hypothetical protein [Hymenobacteraceae bacterium]MDX5513706.1 hypothetical protein [Hymenobacteraceae bacterium]